MEFKEAQYLLFLPFTAALGVWLWRAIERIRRDREKLADRRLFDAAFTCIDDRDRIFTAITGTAAVLCLTLALADPRGALQTTYTPRSGVDVAVLLDVSWSMTAQDVAPSRFDAARTELQALIRNLSYDRIGIIACAGKAFRACPLTFDRDYASDVARTLDVGSVPVPGTNLSGGIRLATEMLDAGGGDNRCLVILSDGEALTGQTTAAATAAAAKSVRIYPVGVGTEKGATLDDRDGRPLKWKGKTVVSRLHADELKRLAEIGRGEYRELRGGVLTELLDDVFRRGMDLEKTRLVRMRQRRALFDVPLLTAILLLTASVVFPLAAAKIARAVNRPPRERVCAE